MNRELELARRILELDVEDLAEILDSLRKDEESAYEALLEQIENL